MPKYKIKYFINGFPALPEHVDNGYTYRDVLPIQGQVIMPFLQSYYYTVRIVTPITDCYPLTYAMGTCYHIELSPHDENAKTAFEMQFGKKRKPK